MLLLRDVFLYVFIYATILPPAGCDIKKIFKQSRNCLNLEFHFSQTSCFIKAKESCLSYYLLIVGERIYTFMHLPRALAQSKMQITSSKIWTRVTNANSCDVNRTLIVRSCMHMFFVRYAVCYVSNALCVW